MGKRNGGFHKNGNNSRRLPTFLELEGLASSAVLGESEAFRAIIENLPVMCYVCEADPPYAPIYVSPTLETFGYSLEEWRTSAEIWLKAVHPDDRAEVIAKTEAARLAGEELDYEYRIVASDESIYWVRDRGRFVRDADGKLVCWLGIMMDVTDRRKTRLKLIESEERYRKVFEDANDIIYIHDLHGNYLWMNRAAERILGYKPEEALRMHMSEITAPDQYERAKAMLQRKLAGDVDKTEYEVECIAKDGHRVTLEVNTSIIYENGVPFAVQGIARDITERKQAEQSIRESESKFRTLAETASDAILTIDGNSNIIFGNAAAETIFGYTPDELAGMSITDLIPDRYREDHLKGIARYSKTGKKGFSWKSVQFPGLHKNGNEIPLEFSFAEFQKDGKRFFTSIIRDVSDRKVAEEALRSSEEQFRELFENANDLLYTHDLTGKMVSINRATERILGYSREEARRMNVNDAIAPESREFAREMIKRKIAGENITEYEIDVIAKDGRRVPVEVSTRLIYKDGIPVGVTGDARDITERKRAENSMRETVSLLTSTLESSNDGIIVLNPEGEIVVHNKRFLEMWSIPPHIISQRNGPIAVDFVKDQMKDPEKFAEDTGRLYEFPLETSLEILEFKDGRIFERYSQPQYLEGVAVGRVCSFRDVTERVRSEERLRHHALHDTLTNLPNRAQFMNHLRQAIEQAEENPNARFAVLFLDVDRFKVVNDSLGHIVGDDLLVAIAERLTACLRPGDVVARLGGDEFTILLNRTGGQDDVAHVAERIQAKLSEPFSIDNYEVFATASVGIIMSDEVRRDPEDFLRDADAAMYRAKEAGKARYAIFDREMHVRNLNLLKIETDLRRAIERGEFRMAYQPIVRLESGVIREFEALLRWHHPEYGVVSPAEFIEVAEETGLIVPIGRTVIEDSCRQIAEWQLGVSTPLAVSVNLSARQLMHPSLIPQVEEALLNTGLASRQLKLEVTETTVMENSEKALAVLEELEELGVTLSTDDFGTGYSSLSYLHRFPFSRLKIDQSFIKRMDKDPKSLAIVKTILMLGRNLGIEVVAEGVETEAQYDLLRSLGCHLGQGYYFSHPVNAEAAGKMLTRSPRAVVGGTTSILQDFSDDPGFESYH
jgi:diguanylate cyclase (GGDEF)-like protein/PAS domain S-box-containing protein